MERFVYADNAATTKISKPVLDAMLPYLTEEYGNPSSLYRFGNQAKRAIEKARKEVADVLNADPFEIIFTAGGTEADNWVKEIMRSLKNKGKNHFITSAVEHHALIHSAQRLEKEGFEVSVYEKEDFSSAPDFSVGTFVSKYDLVLYVGNMENASNQVTNRYQWYTFWGNGDNCPWFTAEVPVVYISMANPYSLVDIPQIQTYINCYSNNDYVIDACVEKLMGRSEFKGKSPVDPFCGKEYLKY